MKKLYKLSKDYRLLAKDLLCGKEAVCFVDYCFYESDKKHRDVGKSAYYETSERYVVGVRGITYIEEYNIQDFIESCEKLNVEFFQEHDA